MITFQETKDGMFMIFRDDVLVGQFSDLDTVLEVYPDAVPENFDNLAVRLINKRRTTAITSIRMRL